MELGPGRICTRSILVQRIVGRDDSGRFIRDQETDTKNSLLGVMKARSRIGIGRDGVTEIRETRGGGTEVSVLLQFPLAVGKTWEESRGDMLEVVEVGVSVTVAAGSFDDCVKLVLKTSRGGKLHFYYCAGVGLVKDSISELQTGNSASPLKRRSRSLGTSPRPHFQTILAL